MGDSVNNRSMNAFNSEPDGLTLDYAGPLIVGVVVGAITAATIYLIYMLIFELFVLTCTF